MFRAANEIRHGNALNEIAWEDAFNTRTRHGNVYRGVREKQGIVVYRQCVANSDISLRVVSLVFRGLDLLKIANINPQQEARFSLWKKLVLRESDENGV